MEQFEYIITVDDPMIWDELWDQLTVDGLGDNFIPTRGVAVVNDRPFNKSSAHFNLTHHEAAELMKDHRIASVELKATLQTDVVKKPTGIRSGNFGATTVVQNDMKNWGLYRCIKDTNPYFGLEAYDNVNGDYTYNLDGTGVDIIVVDTGVDPEHPEFAVNSDGTGGSRVVNFDWSSLGVPGVYPAEYYNGYLGDSDGHGSNCASIAAGNTCGWAAGAAIYSIRIFSGADIRTGSQLGEIDSDLAYDLVRAFHLRKLAEGNTRPTICTNSWGYSAGYSYMEYTVYRGTVYNTTVRNSDYGQVFANHPYSINYINASVDNAAAAGVIMIGAAGNERHKIDRLGGDDYNNYYRFNFQNIYTEDVYYHRGMSPTNANSMICVGSMSSDNSREVKSWFSNSGARVDIYAPGHLIMGAYADQEYYEPAIADTRNSEHYLNKISGTSQAAPQVAGMLACVLQARPEMSSDEVKEFLSAACLNNTLELVGADNYTNTTSLQGGENKILRMPFANPIRGTMGTKE